MQRNNDKIDLAVLGGENEIYSSLTNDFFADTPCKPFKNLCGEYGTAAAFGLGVIVELMKNNDLKNMVMVNNCGDSWALWRIAKN